jgi:hypothetical protein
VPRLATAADSVKPDPNKRQTALTVWRFFMPTHPDPFYDSHAMRARFAPLPRAWLGYSALFGERPTVRICAKCPDRAEAEAQAKAAQHDMTHTLCPRCACDTFNEILDFMKPQDLSGVIASARLLANTIKADVSIYWRHVDRVSETREWKLLPTSETAPSGFIIADTISPDQKPNNPALGS